jgi:peptidoglycan/xylan/chitin deacetylase (PgdA/CDA1 family)/flagellar hook assembly protein FlgD
VKSRTAIASALAVLALCASASGRVNVPSQPALTLKVSPLAFSPNGNGVKDTVRAAIGVDVPVTLLIEIANARGDVAFTNDPGASVNPGTARFHWNGRLGAAAGGRVAPEGKYTLTVTATDPLTGTSSEDSASFVLDTKPPLMLWGRGGVSPSQLTSGPLHLRFRLYDATTSQVTVNLVDQAGRKLKTGRGYTVKPGKVALRWPGTHGTRLPSSTYQLSLAAVDEAGNTGTSGMKRFLVVRPVRSRVWADFDGVGRRIALTFDDCYVGSAWGSILDTLKRYGVKATFFCPGQAVLANPSLARRTVRNGHVIGSHGWDHANFSHLSMASSQSRLDEDREAWWKLARVTPTPYFRPPYGAYTPTTLAAAGRSGYSAVVLWNVDPRDWTNPGASAIESRILSAVRPGSIVLMHTLPQTAAQLPSLLQALRSRHYIPLTLPELARIGAPTSGGWPAFSSAASGA